MLFADRLGDALELVRRVPEATFVLDHLGKPPLERHVQAEWKTNIAALGRLPNVVAKVSGLATESPDAATARTVSPADPTATAELPASDDSAVSASSSD